MRNSWQWLLALLLVSVALGIGANPVLAEEAHGGPSLRQATGQSTRWDLSIAIALSISLPCLAAGYAVGRVGAAALGAASERPELFTRSLVFVALGEGLAVFGFLVALLLWLKL